MNKHQSSPSLKDESVTVSVRVRPLSQTETQQSQSHIWQVIPGPLGQINMLAEWKDRLRKVSAEHQFDNVFAGSDNADIYTAVSDLVQASMEGYSATVFAYGQTSSGKTFTMMGDESNPGVIPRAVSDVFDYISAVLCYTSYLRLD